MNSGIGFSGRVMHRRFAELRGAGKSVYVGDEHCDVRGDLDMVDYIAFPNEIPEKLTAGTTEKTEI